jgi:hypothetical protein
LLPLLACDAVLFDALRAVWRDRQLFDDIGVSFLGEYDAAKARALFDYLFVPTECPAIGTEYAGVGLRLRNSEERLRYAHERHLAIRTKPSVD